MFLPLYTAWLLIVSMSIYTWASEEGPMHPSPPATIADRYVIGSKNNCCFSPKGLFSSLHTYIPASAPSFWFVWLASASLDPQMLAAPIEKLTSSESQKQISSFFFFLTLCHADMQVEVGSVAFNWPYIWINVPLIRGFSFSTKVWWNLYQGTVKKILCDYPALLLLSRLGTSSTICGVPYIQIVHGGA